MMARRFALDSTGCDISEANLGKARDQSAEEPPVLVEFVYGSAEALPFPDATFDAVVCECAVSTFADQSRAVAEFARVLKPGGVIGISDMAVEGELPGDVAEVLAPWTCLSGARSVVGTQQLFLNAGLRVVEYVDESGSLGQLVVRMKQKLLTAALARSVAAIPGLEQLDVKRIRDLLTRAGMLVKEGVVQYARFVFSKGKPRFGPALLHDRSSVTVAAPSQMPCDPSTGCCSPEPRHE
jgi:hypothetical protein